LAKASAGAWVGTERRFGVAQRPLIHPSLRLRESQVRTKAHRGVRAVERDSFVCLLSEDCLRAVVERGAVALAMLRRRCGRLVVSRLACWPRYGGGAAPSIRGWFARLRRLRAAEVGTVAPLGTIAIAWACPGDCVSPTHFGAEGRRAGAAEASCDLAGVRAGGSGCAGPVC